MSIPTPAFQVQCTNPACKQIIPVALPVPDTRALLKPIGQIAVYRITSEEIKEFITQKVRAFENDLGEKYLAGTKLQMQVKYVERKNSSPHRAYASLLVAFSEAIVDTKGEVGFFERIGANESNVDLYEDVKIEIIRKYGFNRKMFEEVLDGKESYKLQEQLEDGLGVTESYLKDIRSYASPVRLKAPGAKENWIFFSADAHLVIKDMLEDPDTDKVAGAMNISDVYPINKDLYEFIVHVKPFEEEVEEDPFVRRLLTGETKNKKK